MKKKSTKLPLILLFIIFSYFLLSVSNYQEQKIKIISEIGNKSKLKKADSWKIGPIEIDNADPTKNWSITEATYGWCNGSGTWEDPYVIENVTIDAMGGRGIDIQHSKVPFIIQNCTIINCSMSHYAIHMWMVNNGTFNNNNLSNALAGIYLSYSNNNTIFNNKMFGNNAGCHLDECDYNNITHNIFDENSHGINAMGDHNIISENTILNSLGYGLVLSHSEHNKIFLNNISFCESVGLMVMMDCHNNSVFKNKIKGTLEGIHLYKDCISNNVTDNYVSNNTAYGFRTHVSDFFNNNVSNNRLSKCGFYIYTTQISSFTGAVDTTNLVNGKPFYLYSRMENLMSDNFSNAGQIILLSCNNSIISDVNTSEATLGIKLYNSYNNTLMGINSEYNSDHGIFLGQSGNNEINENLITNNEHGAYLGYSSYNNLSNNYVLNNEVGFLISHYNYNNTIFHNIISNNTYVGVSIGDTCNHTLIYNNHLDNPNGKNAHDKGDNTRWDNGSIGNYWSNYSGNDLDDDGIGDVPYYVPGPSGSIDNYPIWDDGDDVSPIIFINSPLMNEIYGNKPPEFNIRIIERNLDTLWYTIGGGFTNFSFTSNGTINMGLWNNASEGLITIIFYANDTTGNIGSASVVIMKRIPPKETILGFDSFWLIGMIIGVSVILIRRFKRKLKE